MPEPSPKFRAPFRAFRNRPPFEDLVFLASPLADAGDLSDIRAEVAKRHDEAVKRLQEWIALPSIAAEDRNFSAGAEHTAKLARDAGFQQVVVLNTDGKPGVFATLDAGAKKTVGLYLMYDVKQFDPAEWSSPPLEARIIDRPGVGKVLMGPEAAFLAALHAIRGEGKTSSSHGNDARRRHLGHQATSRFTGSIEYR